jgi:hypothetical protein
LADFPTSPDQLTNEWLSSALGAPVTGFDVQLLGEGAGLLGLVTRLDLDYGDNGDGADRPASIVAKFPTPSPENRVVAETFDMYANEAKFYQGLVNATKLRAPRPYLALLEEETNDFVLLLEDLSSARIGDQTIGCGVEEAEWAIDEMVKLHAPLWGKGDAPEYAWVTVHDNPTQCAGIGGGFEAGWQTFMKGFGDALPSGKVEQFAKIGRQTASILKRLCQGTLTVVHGDFRLDNMFFEVDGRRDGIAMFDWQAICKSCGPHDFSYFMSQNLRTEERREHENGLVERYVEKLREGGVEGYSLDQCWADYRIATLYFFHYAVVIAGTLDLSNERGVKLARVLAERSSAAIEDMEALDLLD